MVRRRVSCVACFSLVLAWLVDIGLATDRINYSGRYFLQADKSSSGSNGESTLDVVQKADVIEITRVENGRTTSSRCPLDGTEGEYTTRGGLSGRCKAQLKGDDLLLEWTAVTPPPDSAHVHTKELWHLSVDSKILTIRSDVYFPKGVNASMSEKYTRTENP